MEIGEGAQPPKPPKKKQPGKLKVHVRGKFDKKSVEGADVSLGSKKVRSDSSGIAEFDGLSAGGYTVKVHKEFPSERHFTFITHYPKVTINHDAASQALAGGTVKEGETTELQADIEIYRPLIKVTLERNHIDFEGDDKYGHWWTVVDDTDSYGWWPKYPMHHPKHSTSSPPAPPPPLSAEPSVAERIQHRFNVIIHTAKSKLYQAMESPLYRTFRGVEGELNGYTSFGGRAKRYGDSEDRDPHARGGQTGHERFQPVLHDERVDADIKALIPRFATSYTGGWAWRFEAGQNCHSFQIAMMNACDLKNFKSL